MNFKSCLRCESNTPYYCEECYQKLIAENAKLQLENKELKIKLSQFPKLSSGERQYVCS